MYSKTTEINEKDKVTYCVELTVHCRRFSNFPKKKEYIWNIISKV